MIWWGRMRFKQKMIGLLLICIWLSSYVTPALSAEPSRKVALIIANQNYTSNWLALDNPLNDAMQMNHHLAQLGFENKLILDTSKARFLQQFGVFINELRQQTQPEQDLTVLVYYAGHGMQFNGGNYIIPVDSRLHEQSQVTQANIRDQYVSLSKLTRRIATLGATTNIVILDACRDLPFNELFSSNNAGLGGWADLVEPNFFVAFGTAPGAKSLDGTGSTNGLFTQAIIEHIHNPGQNLSQLFQRVRKQVMSQSGGAQIPQETNQTTTDFYFVNERRHWNVLYWLLAAVLGFIVVVYLYVKHRRGDKPPSLLIDVETGMVLTQLGAEFSAVGRSQQQDVVLAEHHREVSRRHCQLRSGSRRGCVLLEELGSTNGTFINDSRTPIAVGDTYTLSIGDYLFLAAPKGDEGAVALRVVSGGGHQR